MVERSFGELLKEISAKQPTPGGGAVASWVGALGAALAQMSMRYSIRKKTAGDVRTSIEEYLDEFDRVIRQLLDAADEDGRAYGELNRLQQLAEDDAERMEKWGGAVDASIAAPKRVMAIGLEMLRIQEAFERVCHRWLLSDLAISAILADAAVRSAAWNVRINLPLLDSEVECEAISLEIDSQLRESSAIANRVEEYCRTGN